MLPGRLDLVVEDLARAAAARKEIHLVGDARAGGVDEIDDRMLVLPRELDDPDDLLDGASSPGAGLDRRSRWPSPRPDGPSIAPHAGDDAVGREVPRQSVHEQPVLDETDRRSPAAARGGRARTACSARRASRDTSALLPNGCAPKGVPLQAQAARRSPSHPFEDHNRISAASNTFGGGPGAAGGAPRRRRKKDLRLGLDLLELRDPQLVHLLSHSSQVGDVRHVQGGPPSFGSARILMCPARYGPEPDSSAAARRRPNSAIRAGSW